MVLLGSPLVLASQAKQVSEESTRGLRSTASRLIGRPPPAAGTLPLEPDVQAYLGSTLLPLVELAARGEPVAVLARPAARRDRQRVHLDVEVAPLAQQVDLAVGDPAEVPARPPPRREVVHALAADAPLARHPSAPPGLAANVGRVDRRAQRAETPRDAAGVGPPAARGQVARRAPMAGGGVRRRPVVEGRRRAGQPRPVADRLEHPLVAPASAPSRRARGAPLRRAGRPIAAPRRAAAAAAAAAVALAAGALAPTPPPAWAWGRGPPGPGA